MTDYTPTTNEIQATYMRYRGAWNLANGSEAQFNRWLNEIRAEAWDEGHHAGQHNEHEYRPGRAITNPYRPVQTNPAGE